MADEEWQAVIGFGSVPPRPEFTRAFQATAKQRTLDEAVREPVPRPSRSAR